MKLRNKELHRKWRRKEKVIKAAIKLLKTESKSDISKEVKPKAEKLDKVEKPKKTSKISAVTPEKDSAPIKKDSASKKTSQKKDIDTKENNVPEPVLETVSEEINLSN